MKPKTLVLVAVAVAVVLVGGLAYVAFGGGDDDRRAGALATSSYAVGNYALTIDGVNAGMLKSFSGCGVTANAVSATVGDLRLDTSTGPVKYEGCHIRFGLGMAPVVYTWIKDSLAGKGAPKAVSIVGYDATNQATAQLNLTNARLTSFTVPQLDATNSAAVFFEATLSPESVRKVKASGGAASASKTVKTMLGANYRLTIPDVEGHRASRIGPWSFEIPVPDDAGVTGTTKALVPAKLDDLSVLASDPAPGLDAWLDLLMKGTPTEKPVTIELLDATLKVQLFELRFAAAGLTQGDLLGASTASTDTVPRRQFSMYVEGPALTFSGAAP